MASAQPNFILFITDQQRADHLGCYGHPVLKTPHIDAIAAGGVAMDRFYVASPVCMPNRASLMTGRMPSSHGVRANGVPLARSSVTFVELLTGAGYRTALVGKSHLQNFLGVAPTLMAPEPDAGLRKPPAALASAVRQDLGGQHYEEEDPRRWEAGKQAVNVPFYGFQHVDLVTGHGHQCGADYLRWLREQAPQAERFLSAEAVLEHRYRCPQAIRIAMPEELYPTAFIRDRAVEYLRHAGKDSPFFLMVSFPDPHHPFTPPGRYWDFYKPEEMPRPAAFTATDWQPAPLIKRLIAARESGRSTGEGHGAFAVSEREALEARALTCGMIAFIDDAVGQVLAALQASGRREETVLIFMSDHGDYLGDHRLMLKGSLLYQGLIRTPFLWCDPKSRMKGRRSGAIASTIDVAATVLERAGVAPYRGMEGASQLAALEGRGMAPRESALIQYDHQLGGHRPGRMLRAHGLVTRDWRLSITEGAPGGELYDLKNDPDEFFNRWGDSDAMSDKCAMLERFAHAQVESVDELPLPTGRA
ncbi:MAG: sulfatase family protein [Betaproteobacteria bacterium]